MAQNHHPDVVHFIDNAVTPAFLRTLSRRTCAFKWYGFVRFEKDFADPLFCRALKQSGCEMLKLGLESGDQKVLEDMGKGTDLELVSATLPILKLQAFLLLFTCFSAPTMKMRLQLTAPWIISRPINPILTI
jgi:hypothetical protein